jgi:hypothetical protein
MNMTTQLEQEIYTAQIKCRQALRVLRRLRVARLIAREDHKFFTAQLIYLLQEIDEITSLIVSARHSMRELEDVRGILLESGAGGQYRSGRAQLIQVNSEDFVISEQLIKVQRIKREQAIEIGDKIEKYNREAQILIEEREISLIRRWIMGLSGFPSIADLPQSLNIRLINDLYEDGLYLTNYEEVFDPPARIFN